MSHRILAIALALSATLLGCVQETVAETTPDNSGADTKKPTVAEKPTAAEKSTVAEKKPASAAIKPTWVVYTYDG